MSVPALVTAGALVLPSAGPGPIFPTLLYGGSDVRLYIGPDAAYER